VRFGTIQFPRFFTSPCAVKHKKAGQTERGNMATRSGMIPIHRQERYPPQYVSCRPSTPQEPYAAAARGWPGFSERNNGRSQPKEGKLRLTLGIVEICGMYGALSAQRTDRLSFAYRSGVSLKKIPPYASRLRAPASLGYEPLIPRFAIAE